MKKYYGKISYNFVNALFAILLAIGFLEWLGVNSTLQYVLFLFTFILIAKYWISHRNQTDKYPPKNISGVLIDITSIFVIFLIVKAAILPLGFYFASLAILRTLDALGSSRTMMEYSLKKAQIFHFKSMRFIYFTEATVYVLFETIMFNNGMPYVFGMTALMLLWIFGQIAENTAY